MDYAAKEAQSNSERTSSARASHVKCHKHLSLARKHLQFHLTPPCSSRKYMLAPGIRLKDRYRILEQIGGGGFWTCVQSNGRNFWMLCRY